MPRKEQGWITFQTSDEERQILEQICQQTQRTKTEVLREMIRRMGQSFPAATFEPNPSEDLEDEAVVIGSSHATQLQAIKLSTRNILPAKVKRLVKGTVNAEVTLTIAPGMELVSIVTRTSAEKLGLKKGKEVWALIKSSSITIATQ